MFQYGTSIIDADLMAASKSNISRLKNATEDFVYIWFAWFPAYHAIAVIILVFVVQRKWFVRGIISISKISLNFLILYYIVNVF